MGRARGSNLISYGVFESSVGVTPGVGGGTWNRLPIVSHTMGEERPLLASNLLGQGREMLDPTLDVANNVGDVVVPVDLRNFGFWLKLFLGAPTTTAYAAASGTLTLTANPAPNSTVTVNGSVVTFVSSGATGAQVNIGANPAATATALQAYLAGLSSGPASTATYAVASNVITATAKASGPGGNAFTIAAQAAANITLSGATLAGGANQHVFASGAASLPSLSFEIGNPDVPSYSTHYGIRGNEMKIAMTRSGLLDATCSLIAIGESVAATTTAVTGTPSTLATQRFAQAAGAVKMNGAQIAGVTQGNLMMKNNLEIVPTIQSTGRIEDSDPGQFMADGDITVRFQDQSLLNMATSNTPIDLNYGWTYGPYSLMFDLPRVFLPRPKRPVSGPNGIQAQFNWQASGALGASLTATLVNDVASGIY